MLRFKISAIAAQLIVAMLLLGAWMMATHAVGGAFVHKFGVNGKAVLCVLSSDLDSDLLSYNDESTHLSVGLGNTPGFAFSFDANLIQHELHKGIFNLHPELEGLRHVNTLGGQLGFLSVPDAKRLGPAIRARDLSDEWFANGRCSGMVVVPLSQSDLFEVKCAATDNYSNVLNSIPDQQKPLPLPNSVVVASCLEETISSGKFKGKTHHPCRRALVFDGFIFDYQIQKDNLPLYPEIDRFLQSKLISWKKNCSLSR